MKFLISTAVALTLLTPISASANAKGSSGLECIETLERKCEIQIAQTQVQSAQISVGKVISILWQEIFFSGIPLLGCLFLFKMISVCLKGFITSLKQMTWSTTRGKVSTYEVYSYQYTSTYTNTPRTKYGYKLFYTYTVNNNLYTGTDDIDGFKDNSEASRHVLTNYPNSRNLEVYYNSQNCQNSIIRSPFIMLLWSIIMFLLFFPFFIIFNFIFVYRVYGIILIGFPPTLEYCRPDLQKRIWIPCPSEKRDIL
jgi:Protein of unknown function (DUF3592)